MEEDGTHFLGFGKSGSVTEGTVRKKKGTYTARGGPGGGGIHPWHAVE